MLYSKHFHQASKQLPNIDKTNMPKEWKTTVYKTYELLPTITLPAEPSPVSDLFVMLKKRRSVRKYSGKSLTKTELGTLLKAGCGISDTPFLSKNKHRTYPSGGARYSIEVYALIINGNIDIPPGIYHYNVSEHSLDVIEQKTFTANELKDYFSNDWTAQASCALILTSVFHRTQNKYGERGYRMALLEAGHIGQNISLISEALNLKHCPYAATRDTKIESLIDIDGVTESLLHTIILGAAE